MTVKIEINGVQHTIINPYYLPAYLQRDYLENSAKILSTPPVFVPDDEQCLLCGHYKENMPGQRLTLCRSLRLNKSAGYVLKICIYCRYWLLVNQDHYDLNMVPAKIASNMKRPKYLDNFL